MTAIRYCGIPAVSVESSSETWPETILAHIRKKNGKAAMESTAAYTALAELLSEEKKSGLLDKIAYTDTGKPVFTEGGLYFSLSHTDGAAVAVLADRPVGADIEKMVEDRDFLRLAKRFLDEESFLALKKAPQNDIAERFYSLWTAYEACAKLIGDGIAAHIGRPLPSGIAVKTSVVTIDGAHYVLTVAQK